jgi:hypothetical protein
MFRTLVGTTIMALSLAFLPVESFGQQADTPQIFQVPYF